MKLSADRASGAFFLIFGLALVFGIIPNYVEDPTGGSISPRTLPIAYSCLIALGGFLLIIWPTGHELQDWRYIYRTLLFSAVLGISIYAISWFGFVVVAPFLALTIMLMVGERRPLLLLAGTVVMPAVIWLFVTQFLDRPLP